MYIKARKFKDLQVPVFTLNGRILEYVNKEKYLGFIMSNDCKDDLDMNRQMRSIYGRGNMLIKNFKHCTDNVKTRLFNTFCSNFYCSHLWHNFNRSSLNKVRVAFKKIYRSLFGLDRLASITQHMVSLNTDSFDVLIRKSSHNFYERLVKSENMIIGAIVNSMFFFDSSLYKHWLKVIY